MKQKINLFDSNNDFFESSTDSIDINKLNFKVHASLIYKLGESLIADEITAISELMKNSYDADASVCHLEIDPNFVGENGEQGLITIKDNGIGMDLATIINGWLTISNSPKRKMKELNQTTERFNRIPLGEKGLGRLSVQKLGKNAKLITKTKDSNLETTIIIPWAEFSKNTTLDNINIVCSQTEVDNDKSYTTIIISDLINVEYWKSDESKKELEKTINKIVSPFKSKNNNFSIIAKIGNYSADVSNSMFNDILSTARNDYHFSVSNESIEVNLIYKINSFKKRNVIKNYHNFDFSRDYFKEFFSKIKNKYSEAEMIMNGNELYSIKFSINFSDFPALIRNKETGELYYPGDFSGSIYDFSYDKEYIEDLLKNHDFIYALQEEEYKEYIKNNKGIRVVRDGFVVQGYGDGNLDWLNISKSATTSGKYADLRNENLIGCVFLTGKNNQVLKETTSREGFITDDYYNNFYYIIREIIIDKINKVNSNITALFKEYLDSLFVKENSGFEDPFESIDITTEHAKASLNIIKQDRDDDTKTIDKIEKNINSKADQISFNDDIISEYKSLVDAQKALIDDLNKQIDEFDKTLNSINVAVELLKSEQDKQMKSFSDVFELAGLGISVELFTHEMFTTINNVSDRLKKGDNNPSDLRYISNSMNSLRKQLSYFHPGLKYVRMKKEEKKIIELINSHIDFYDDKAKLNGIIFNVIDKSSGVKIRANIGLINQVLDNLFSNSVYWLKYSRDTLKEINECIYNIEIDSKGHVIIWDNGIGISNNIENDLFNPFVSCKKDGRGLGLFVCKNNLENNNASIRLLRERNQFNRLYKFQIDLSNMII